MKAQENGKLLIIPRDQIKEETKDEKREFLIRGLPRNNIAIFAGTGSSGKGFVTLAMLDQVGMFLNKDPMHDMVPRKIAYMNFEDDLLTISTRLGEPTYHDWDYVDCIGKSLFNEIKVDGVQKRVLNNDLFDHLKEYDLLIVDTWALSSGIDENDNATTSKAMRSLKGYAYKNNLSIVLVHHTSKAGMNAEATTGTSQIRGASALTDNARLVVLVHPKIENKKFSKTHVVAEIVKANYTMVDEQEYKRGERGVLEIVGSTRSSSPF